MTIANIIKNAFEVANDFYRVQNCTRDQEIRLERAEEDLQLAEDSASWAERRFLEALDSGWGIPSRMVGLVYWRGRVEELKGQVAFETERLADCWAQSAQIGHQFELARRQLWAELASVPSVQSRINWELEAWADLDGQLPEEDEDDPFEGYWYEMEIEAVSAASISHMGKGVIKCSPPFERPRKGQKRPSKPFGKRFADRRPRQI